jgi:putative nucleotidyltransferase with HDIG domain
MEKTRQDAWNLLNEYTHNPNLVKHMLAVEAAMRAYARRFDEDEEKWAILGLLHDFDYERFPEEHPQPGARILRERGWPEEIVRGVLSHAAEKTGVERESRMEKALYAVDDLTGLIVAVALVRPSKDIRDVKVRSVRKKWKDQRFAAGAHREAAEEGAEALGIDLWEHVGVVLEAMKGIASELELDGRTSD